VIRPARSASGEFDDQLGRVLALAASAFDKRRCRELHFQQRDGLAVEGVPSEPTQGGTLVLDGSFSA
jgi:hypothetical protein